MASSINYGVTAPGGTDPYPVETALATEVGKNSPQEAYNLLNMYGIQNMVGADNYNYALEGQHDFAKQQLAAQMHENNMKALEAGYKTPGLLAAYNSPQYADIVAGIDPNQMQSASTNLERAQSAETFNKAAGGAFSSVQAGYDPDAAKLAQLTGGVTGPQGEALSTKNAIIAANARLAAAALRAKAQAASDNKITVPLAPQDSLGGAAPSATMLPHETAEQFAARMRGRSLVVGDAPIAPPQSGTNLQKAQADTGTRVSNTAKGGDVHAQAESYVENVVRKANPKIYADIQAGKVGGRVNVVTGSDGQPHIKGKERTY